MKRYIIFVFVASLVVFSCVDDKRDKENLTKQYRQDTLLIVEEYYMKDKLRLLKQMSLDSINNNGYQIHYGENGEIKKWLWFNKNEKYPEIVIYFDSLGNYESFKGTPFLSAGSRENKKVIQVVNPPIINYMLGYREFKDSIIVKQEAYYPGVAMGKGWLVIDEHEFVEGYKYFIYYYFLNDNKRIIDSAFVELLP